VAVQLPLTILSTCGLLLLICELVQVLRHGKPVSSLVYTHHVWVYGIWLLGHNAIYITMYMWQWTQFVQRNKEKPATPLPQEPALPQPEKETVILRLGNKTRVIRFLDILYCTVSDNLTLICTTGHECLLAEKSLEQLDDLLPPDVFFRANRQFIIHRDLIVSTERIENGKIKLLLKPTPKLPNAIIISRTKAPAFKEWLKMAAV
jgi:DNA-binding LytR/AlgR family response regulator